MSGEACPVLAAAGECFPAVKEQSTVGEGRGSKGRRGEELVW